MKLKAIFFLLFLPMLGCAGAPGSKPIDLPAAIFVSNDINPDASGRPSPLVIVLYQLRASDSFVSKDYFSIFDPQGQVLADDLLEREQITVQPGVDRNLPIRMNSSAQYLGVLAAFSDIEAAKWRAVIELPLDRTGVAFKGLRSQRVLIDIDERSVDIELAKQ